MDAGAAKQDTDAKGRKKPQRQDWMIERTVIINGNRFCVKVDLLVCLRLEYQRRYLSLGEGACVDRLKSL